MGTICGGGGIIGICPGGIMGIFPGGIIDQGPGGNDVGGGATGCLNGSYGGLSTTIVASSDISSRGL